MIDFFVEGLLSINKLLFNNLGLTIIFVGVASRLAFHPLIISSLRYSKAARDLKPKLDEIKRRHGKDVRKMADEQSKAFKDAGVNPAAGALGCLSLVVQLGVFFILFRALLHVIGSDINTGFLIWDLAQKDIYPFSGLPLPVPGFLITATAVLSLVQSKMMTPEESDKKGKDDKGDLTSMFALQGPMVFMFPLIILISGTQFPAGLVLYWLVITIFGIIQQYQAVGIGGLRPWLKKLRK